MMTRLIYSIEDLNNLNLDEYWPETVPEANRFTIVDLYLLEDQMHIERAARRRNYPYEHLTVALELEWKHTLTANQQLLLDIALSNTGLKKLDHSNYRYYEDSEDDRLWAVQGDPRDS